MLNIELLDINASTIALQIENFISREVKLAGLNGAVIAVSGGIDSSVLLALTARALGPENVRAVTIPERDITLDSDITDVMQLTREYDVTCDTVEITPILRVIREVLPHYDESDRVTLGNIKPRLRMLISYYYSNKFNYMMIGSSNKTEFLTGYFTKYGDGGVDLMPLADLYKCQIRQIAEFLEIPRNIIEKKPSGGLWPGQTDEGEMGACYDSIDLILYGMERGYSGRDIAGFLSIDQVIVNSLIDRVKSNEHKRRLPLVLRLSDVTV